MRNPSVQAWSWRAARCDLRAAVLFGLVTGLPFAGVSEACAQTRGPVYANLRYEDDYSFLRQEGERSKDPLYQLKLIPVFEKGELSLGGSYRFRYENDHNRRFGASDPPAQSFYLHRLFLFADIQIAGRARLFGEFKYADIVGNELPPPVTAHDKFDWENLFLDFWLLKSERGTMGLRAGRQEMLFGRERTISPSDWLNTRRTFDGLRLMAHAGGWKFDAFATRPVELDPQEFNQADESQIFAGIYLQRPLPNKTFAAYYLWLREQDERVNSGSGTPGGFNYHTLGLAFEGRQKNFDWTGEAAYQSGNFSTDGIAAYMLSLEGGYTFSTIWAKPRLALGFDVETGDQDPADDKKQTYNLLFAVGHPYFGWADQVGRQNIKSAAVFLTAKPHARITVKLQGYHFVLEEKRDALYNAGGAVSRRDATGAAGGQVGDEFDAEVTFNFNVHLSAMLGYTRFMPGNFIKNTGAAATHSLFYVMVPVKF